MNTTKTRSSTLKFSLPALSIALLLAAGCHKAENPTAEMPDTKPMTAAPVAAAAQGAMPSTGKIELPPALSPEIVTNVLGARTASVFEQIDQVAKSHLTSTQKAQLLLLILPSFNRDGQRQIAHAVVNYIEDSTHTLIRDPLLEGKLDPQILSVFMTDTLKRPNSVKLPILTVLARTPEHPLQAESRDLLSAYSKQSSNMNTPKPDQVMQ